MKSVGPVKQARMLVAIERRAHTYSELEAISGLKHESVAIWIKALRNHGLVYISNWNKDSLGRSTVPAFAWGPGRTDAIRPAIPAYERVKAHRGRVK